MMIDADEILVDSAVLEMERLVVDRLYSCQILEGWVLRRDGKSDLNLSDVDELRHLFGKQSDVVN
jgi:hypothetical protein